MIIETRILGKKGRPLDGWVVPDPPRDADASDGPITLRALITRVVRDEVAAFERRDRTKRLVRVLSEREIARDAAQGRVDPGGRPSTGDVDAEVAVAAAMQGFLDGLYLVILDGVEQRDLDREVWIRPDSTLVFLRLTFLAGA